MQPIGQYLSPCDHFLPLIEVPDALREAFRAAMGRERWPLGGWKMGTR